MAAQNKGAPSQGSTEGTGTGRAGTKANPSPPLDKPRKASFSAGCALRTEVLGCLLHFRALCLVTHRRSSWVWTLQPCGHHKASVSSAVLLQGKASSDPMMELLSLTCSPLLLMLPSFTVACLRESCSSA